jgi:uncharacterized protein YjdB
MLAAVVGAGCGDGYFHDPAPDKGRASLALAAAPLAGSPVDAFDQVDRLNVLLREPDGGRIVATRQSSFDPTAQETRVPIEVDLEGSQTTLELRVTLARGEAPLFFGQRSVTLEVGTTTEAEVSLVPVPAGVVAPASFPDLTGQGETLTLVAAVVMDTGDTIPGLEPQWASENPEVVAVSEVGGGWQATAVSDGTTELVATFATVIGDVPLTFEDRVEITVRSEVASVDVQPAEVELESDGQATLVAIARDANGDVLPDRAVTWASRDENVAVVDDNGVVTAVEPGATNIIATVEGVEGSARVLVREPEPPPPPADVSVVYADGIRISWIDVSDGQATYEVERAVSASPGFDGDEAPDEHFELLATLPAGTESFLDLEPAWGLLEYRVRACGAGGCSAFSDVVWFEFPIPPLAVTDSIAVTGLIDNEPAVSLFGRADPRGTPTSTYFELDLSPSFSAPFVLDAADLPGSFGLTSVVQLLGVVSPGITFYGRLVAANTVGVSVGNIVSFQVPVDGDVPAGVASRGRGQGNRE